MTARSGKQHIDKSVAVTEALLNEIKGNIFEFSVGRELARNVGIEVEFLEEFGIDGMTWLSPYESYLRAHHPKMITSLMQLARPLALELVKYLPREISQIQVVGKRSRTGVSRGRDESDLLVHTPDATVVPVSLKLAKARSYVNTKSGGIKSFLSEYLEFIEGAPKLQAQLSHQVDHCFDQMGRELYESAGLDWSGHFDEHWPYSKLPGELPPEIRARVVATYAELAQFIYRIFERLMSEDPALVRDLLRRLLGHSDSHLVQAICFHSGDQGHDYTLTSVYIQTNTGLTQDLAPLKLLPYKAGLASFEFELERSRFQIRVKPMNIFTTPSYKINCSVKHDC